MDEMYGSHSSSGGYEDYADRALMSPENLMIAAEYTQYYQYDPAGFESAGFRYQCCESAASVTVHHHENQNNNNYYNNNDDELAYSENSSVIKARIASHPCYPKLLHAYIDCQKVGAPPEIACLLDEIVREKDVFKLQYTDADATATATATATAANNFIGLDPELDHFMETYCDLLVKYKADLSRPFDEATSFLNNIQTQLGNLSTADSNGAMSSDEELSGGETDQMEDQRLKMEDRELKDRLLHMYGNHINSLKLEFSKKKKKGKLPKEARQALLEWWNVHYKWPYPTEADKVSLAEMTGLDPKQINNWFINQRKRHWKPSENMHLAMMDSLSGHFCMDN